MAYIDKQTINIKNVNLNVDELWLIDNWGEDGESRHETVWKESWFLVDFLTDKLKVKMSL